MDFLRKLFSHTHFGITSDSKEKTNITIANETAIDQFNTQVVNNSNKNDTESSDTNEDATTNSDSSVVIIEEFGVTKTFHYLENVTPVEVIPTTACIELEENEIRLSDGLEHAFTAVTAEASPVSVTVDETVRNKNDNNDKEVKILFKVASNDAATLNNLLNDKTGRNLKAFEEALNNPDENVVTDNRSKIINLDEFFEIFDELHPVEEPIAENSSENSNNENSNNSKEMTDPINERHPNINENIDVISISSTEDKTEVNQTGVAEYNIPINTVSDQSDSDDGYNSSDFEFITEPEANLTGFVINYGLDNCQNLSPASSEPLINYCGGYFNGETAKEPSDLGEGTSRQNRPRNEFEDRSYRNNHHIPEGGDYLGLFQGIYNPLLPMSEIYFLENKSVRASAMNSQYDGIGFDKQLAMRRHQPDSSEDEFEDEAKESAKKILNMYPRENRKRRRRHF